MIKVVVAKIVFPIFVFCNDDFRSYIDNRDLLIRSKNKIKDGFFQRLEILDSNGILWRVLEVNVDGAANIPVMLHLFKWSILGAVKISKVEKVEDFSKSVIIERIAQSVCSCPSGVSEQFDKDELISILTRKKSIKSIIEFFSGTTPDFLKQEFTFIEVNQDES